MTRLAPTQNLTKEIIKEKKKNYCKSNRTKMKVESDPFSWWSVFSLSLCTTARISNQKEID